MIDFVGISPFSRIALRVAMETMHFFYTFARLKIDQTLVFKLSGCYSGRGYEWSLCYSPTTYDHFFDGWSLYYHHHLRITENMKKDLHLWLQFFRDLNGVSVFHDRLWVANEDIQLFTDSSGSWFWGIFLGKMDIRCVASSMG